MNSRVATPNSQAKKEIKKVVPKKPVKEVKKAFTQVIMQSGSHFDALPQALNAGPDLHEREPYIQRISAGTVPAADACATED